MRSLSSVIKGGRILNQTVINLEERAKKHLASPQVSEDPIQVALDEHYAKLKDEAREEANRILEEAKQEACEILENAKMQSNALQNEILALKQTTLEQVKQQEISLVENAKIEAEAIINNAYMEKQQILEEAEPEMVQLIIKLLGHIVGDAMFENAEWVNVLVKKMINKESISDDLTIVIAPPVYEKLMENETNTFSLLKGTVSVRQDETLNDTTCIVETPQGDIVYDIREGLNAVLRELKILQTLQ